MDRRKIERLTASIAVFLLLFTTFAVIFFAADQFFNWDIFPPDVETFLGFVIVALVAIIFSSVLVNVMLNLSIIAINTNIYIEKHLKKDGK